MQLLRNGDNLFFSVREFVENSSNLFIFAPYIKTDALEAILHGVNSCKIIVVRWQAKDLVSGASDLDVYNFCKANGIKLFINQRLHLKAYVDSYKRCLLGSANISSRALNMPESPMYNYELATIVTDLEFHDRHYFSSILNESTLVDDILYGNIMHQIELFSEIEDVNDFELDLVSNEKDFLISSLPMSSSVKTLSRVYTEHNGIHEEELNCAMHDIALYKIPLGLNEENFIQHLKQSFFAHPFIKAFIHMLQSKGGEIYFGEAKAWIQSNCTNVPIPRRWEITENIQILYRWFVELGDGVLLVDRPNHSERLRLYNP